MRLPLIIASLTFLCIISFADDESNSMCIDQNKTVIHSTTNQDEMPIWSKFKHFINGFFEDIKEFGIDNRIINK
ncbi:MAG: hypothetical protein ACXW33_03995 [Sulfuricurvum sp.]